MATDHPNSCYSCQKPGHWYKDCPNRRPSHGLTTPPPQTEQALVQRKSKDSCYSCNEIGHWSNECPNNYKTLKRPHREVSGGFRASKNDLDVAVIECSHGHGACSVHTSLSAKNPNRKYFQCSRKRSVGFCGAERCDFFQWCDEVKLPENVPMCPCGAGRCSVRREKTGPNAGRWSFSCRVQKGHGACSFFQWENAESKTEHNTEAVDKAPLTPLQERIDQLTAVVTASGGSCSDAIDACTIDWDSESDMDKTPQASRPSAAQNCVPRRLEFSEPEECSMEDELETIFTVTDYFLGKPQNKVTHEQLSEAIQCAIVARSC